MSDADENERIRERVAEMFRREIRLTRAVFVRRLRIGLSAYLIVGAALLLTSWLTQDNDWLSGVLIEFGVTLIVFAPLAILVINVEGAVKRIHDLGDVADAATPDLLKGRWEEKPDGPQL